MKPIVLVIGTRPDAIKLLPLYFALKKEHVPVILCSTFQHDDLLKQVLHLFRVTPDSSLHVMRENQDLYYLTSIILEKMKELYTKYDPAYVVVQGDTTTAYAAGLAAFYAKIPVAHVEAGIRSFDKYGPFPEEVNRKMIATFADVHFAPTQNSVLNLLHEGVSRSAIVQTGNTVTDALRIIKQKINDHDITLDAALVDAVEGAKRNKQKIILFTVHRRESFGSPLQSILEAIKEYAQEHPHVSIFFPAHPNPSVQALIREKNIASCSNIVISKPYSYENTVYLASSCDLVVTDSGGLQEEAASLGKYAVIVRDRTDRPESVFAGLATVVGSSKKLIKHEIDRHLYHLMPNNEKNNLFGDGYASEKIVRFFQQLPLQKTSYAGKDAISSKESL